MNGTARDCHICEEKYLPYALQAAKTGIILFCLQSVGMGCAVFCGLKKPCGELQFGWQKRKRKEIDTVSSFPHKQQSRKSTDRLIPKPSFPSLRRTERRAQESTRKRKQKNEM